jgi:KipI family sensor histidine kinase inhibitor
MSRGRTAADEQLAAPPRVLPMGERALLLELPSLEDALAWTASLRDEPLPGQEWSLVAARTVLLRFETAEDALEAASALEQRTPGTARRAAGRTRRVPVVYDGEDLAEVARATGLSEDAVVAAHTGTDWTAAFGGFAPGFVYLTGGDERLSVPRRDTPRTRVPAGAVALAGEFSAVYPKASPGGWQLIGRTGAVLFDPDAKDPALIRPGDTVRFEAARERVRAARRKGGTAGSDDGLAAALPDVPAGTPALEILSPGLRTLIEDSGRPGRGDLGVTLSGAADGASARQANRLVGNPMGAALLETVLGGLRVRARGDLVVALSGAIGEAEIAAGGRRADGGTTAGAGGEGAGGTRAAGGTGGGEGAADAGADGGQEDPSHVRAAPAHEPFGLRDGETLELAAPPAGLRGYLAVRGGIEAPQQLGSRSSDTLSGLGPRPLGAGDVLAIGAADPHRSVGTAEVPATILPGAGATRPAAGPAEETDPDGPVQEEPAAPTISVRIRRGPRADWAEQDALLGRTWSIGGDSDRVGARLEPADDAPPLRRRRSEELASEGMVPGAIQLPPSGLPVVFLVDHPVTGGYPVIAVVAEEDLPLLAQLPPGSRVGFEQLAD